MKKLFLSAAFLLVTTLMAQAQFFTLGVKGGASSSSVDPANPQGTIAQLREQEKITGFHAGAFTRFNVLGFVLQPEVVLSTSGGNIEMIDSRGETTVEKLGFTHVDFPVMVGYQLLFARAYAGPVASRLLKSDWGKEDIKEYLNTSDWGYQVGGGIDISKLTLDVRYERLRRPYLNEGTGSVDFRNEQIVVSLGYKLIGK